MRGIWPLDGVAAGCPEIIYEWNEQKIHGRRAYDANLMGLVKLLQGDCVVQKSHPHITTVNDLCP